MKKKKLLFAILSFGIIFSQSTPVLQVFAAETPNEANIENTNVAYDMKMLYGGDNWQKYDLSTLEPKFDTDKDLTFKYYVTKPVDDSLYLYLFTYNEKNDEVLSANFSISNSKTQVNGIFQDVFTTKTARYINSYGYRGRFHKFCLDGVVNKTEDFRFYIQKAYVTYTGVGGNTYSTEWKTINDEFAFSIGSNGDFTYKYWKDDYIRITDALVNVDVNESNPQWNIDTYYWKAKEDFYYFFSTDRTMEELIEVQYDYEYVTYDAIMDFKDSKLNHPGTETKGGKSNWGQVYVGLMNGISANTSGNHNNAKEIKNIRTEKKFNNVVKAESYTQTLTKPYFLWWTQEVKYTMNNIQNCLKTDDLVGDEYKDFKSVIERVQNQRVAENKSKFQWAFRINSDERKVLKSWTEKQWWTYFTLGLAGNKNFSKSECHEVKQGMVTWLKFRTGNQIFSLNALDIPRDTESLTLNSVPFETLMDVVRDSVGTYFSAIWNGLSKIIDNIVPILFLVLGIVVVVLIFPIVKPVLSAVGMVMNSGVKKAKRKNKKKEKQEKKKNDS